MCKDLGLTLLFGLFSAINGPQGLALLMLGLLILWASTLCEMEMLLCNLKWACDSLKNWYVKVS